MSYETKKQTTKNLYLISKRTNHRYVLNGDVESDAMPENEELSRDFAEHMVLEKSDLPKKVDLRPWMTKVEDQSTLKSCTANALAGAYEYLHSKATGQKIDVSRLFIYYNSRIRGLSRFGWLSDSGSSIDMAIQSLFEDGVCLEDMWEYDRWKVNDKPYSECYEAAKEHTILEALQVRRDLNVFKTCLAQGFPIVVSINVFSSFDKAAERGIVPMPRSFEDRQALHGRHAILIVGYSNSSQAFIVRNSWGENWGDQGYCYIPYDYIADPKLTNYAWTVKRLNVESMGHTGWCNVDGVNYTQRDENDESNELEGARSNEGDDEENEADMEEIDEDVDYVEYDEKADDNNDNTAN